MEYLAFAAAVLSGLPRSARAATRPSAGSLAYHHDWLTLTGDATSAADLCGERVVEFLRRAWDQASAGPVLSAVKKRLQSGVALRGVELLACGRRGMGATRHRGQVDRDCAASGDGDRRGAGRVHWSDARHSAGCVADAQSWERSDGEITASQPNYAERVGKASTGREPGASHGGPEAIDAADCGRVSERSSGREHRSRWIRCGGRRLAPMSTWLQVLADSSGHCRSRAAADVRQRGHLALVRFVARRREIAIRQSLGAGRIQLVRQMVLGGILPFACRRRAGVSADLVDGKELRRFIPPNSNPIVLNGTMDHNVVIVIVLLSVLASVICGAFPALRSSRVPAAEALKEESASVSGGSHNRRSAQRAGGGADCSFTGAPGDLWTFSAHAPKHQLCQSRV